MRSGGPEQRTGTTNRPYRRENSREKHMKNRNRLQKRLDMADTGSVVNRVRATSLFGRMSASGNQQKKNDMVSANAARRRR